MKCLLCLSPLSCHQQARSAYVQERCYALRRLALVALARYTAVSYMVEYIYRNIVSINLMNWNRSYTTVA